MFCRNLFLILYYLTSHVSGGPKVMRTLIYEYQTVKVLITFSPPDIYGAGGGSIIQTKAINIILFIITLRKQFKNKTSLSYSLYIIIFF